MVGNATLVWCHRTRRERMTSSCERRIIPSNSQRSSLVVGSLSTVQTGKPLCEQFCDHHQHNISPEEAGWQCKRGHAPKGNHSVIFSLEILDLYWDFLLFGGGLICFQGSYGPYLQHVLEYSSPLHGSEHLDVPRHRVSSSENGLQRGIAASGATAVSAQPSRRAIAWPSQRRRCEFTMLRDGSRCRKGMSFRSSCTSLSPSTKIS